MGKRRVLHTGNQYQLTNQFRLLSPPPGTGTFREKSGQNKNDVQLPAPLRWFMKGKMTVADGGVSSPVVKCGLLLLLIRQKTASILLLDQRFRSVDPYCFFLFSYLSPSKVSVQHFFVPSQTGGSYTRRICRMHVRGSK